MLTLKFSPGRDLSVGLPQPQAQLDNSLCRCGASMPLQVRLGLRSRSRPVLEGRWTCGPRCLRRQVAAMVQRELQTAPVRPAYRHRVPLGLLLHSTGAVSHEDVRRALVLQRSTGERIGKILQRVAGLSERTVADALAMQWGCGLSTEVALDGESAACLAPRRLLEHTGMLPIRMTRERRLHVAFVDSLDALAIFALQRMHHVTVTAGIAPASVWTDGHARLVQADPVAVKEFDCADEAAMEREIVQTLCRVQPVESRFVRVHDMYWLRLWLEPAALAGGPSQREDVQDMVFLTARSKPQAALS